MLRRGLNAGVLVSGLILSACDDPRPTEPPHATRRSLAQDGTADPVVQEVRQLAAVNGIGPIPTTPEYANLSSCSVEASRSTRS